MQLRPATAMVGFRSTAAETAASGSARKAGVTATRPRVGTRVLRVVAYSLADLSSTSARRKCQGLFRDVARRATL